MVIQFNLKPMLAIAPAASKNDTRYKSGRSHLAAVSRSVKQTVIYSLKVCESEKESVCVCVCECVCVRVF
jgi:hypothetical protein